MYWINFLHIYQPPWQDGKIVKKIANESYRYLLDTLKKYPDAKITLNICGSLTEQLNNLRFFDIIENIKKLAQRGQIELTGTAMYHAFLPLLPESEIIRQIKLNEAYNEKIFGKNTWKTPKNRGFFIPEMAYSKKVAKIIARLGFKWIILDEIAIGKKLGNIDWQKKYSINGAKPELGIVFRDRKIYRKSFSGKTFDTMQILKMPHDKNKIIVTARDGESYGDSMWNNEKNLAFETILRNKIIKTLTVSEYLNYLDESGAKKTAVNPAPCSWESLESELTQNKHYEIWSSKENKIHQELWRFTNTVIKTLNQNQKDKNFSWARRHLDRALASCTFWWADGRFKGYNPEEIEKGALELIKTIRSLEDLNHANKIYFEKLYSRLIYDIWSRHWKKS